MEVEATEDEYFEQELLDFLGMIQQLSDSAKANRYHLAPNGPSLLDALIGRFHKIDSVMPDDQYERLFDGLTRLTKHVYDQPSVFAIWKPYLSRLFQAAKMFKQRHPRVSVPAPPSRQPPSPPPLKHDQSAALNLLESVQAFERASAAKNLLDSVKEFDSASSARSHPYSCPRFNTTGCKDDLCTMKHACSECDGPHPRFNCPINRERGRPLVSTSSATVDRERERERIRPTLPNPRLEGEHITKMLGWMSERQREIDGIDAKLDHVYPFDGISMGVCQTWNEGRCHHANCRNAHVCWSCRGFHHSSVCPHQPCKPYDAPPIDVMVCTNWNYFGCSLACYCADRHVCLVCQGPHPMRHSKRCLWRYHEDVEAKQRSDILKEFAMKPPNERRNLKKVGAFGQPQDPSGMQQPQGLRPPTMVGGGPAHLQQSTVIPQSAPFGSGPITQSIHQAPQMHAPASGPSAQTGTAPATGLPFVTNSANGQSVATPVGTVPIPMDNWSVSGAAPATTPPGFVPYTPQGSKERKISITEICVLYNTEQGCPGDHVPDVICSLTHRCRGCFQRHSYHDCPLDRNRLECFAIGDIVRQGSSVHTITNFGTKFEGVIASPSIMLREIGEEQSVECTAGHVYKVVSSLTVKSALPRARVCTDNRNAQNTKKLLERLLSESKFMDGYVVETLEIGDETGDIQIVFSDENSKAAVCGFICGPQFNIDCNVMELDDSKWDEPAVGHMYYCRLCNVSATKYYDTCQHIESEQHRILLSKKPVVRAPEPKVVFASGRFNCRLCNTNFSASKDLKDHVQSPIHDQNNILMMLSLVRCKVDVGHECLVCQHASPNSMKFFEHCHTAAHRSCLEEAIEPCANFNTRSVGCKNERCQFKHVCSGCHDLVPRYECSQCKSTQFCKGFNDGGGGCWYSTETCKSKHACSECSGAHPKTSCPRLTAQGQAPWFSGPRQTQLRPGTGGARPGFGASPRIPFNGAAPTTPSLPGPPGGIPMVSQQNWRQQPRGWSQGQFSGFRY